MHLVKLRGNIRQYYKDSSVIIHGLKHKLKIKASKEDYIDIQKIFSKALNGIELYALNDEFPEYKNLINLFHRQNIFYSINSECLKKHSEKDYFNWIEQKFENVSENLNLVTKIKICIPDSFNGKDYLIKLLDRNNISYEVSNTNNFKILLLDKEICEYQIYELRDEEFIVSPVINKFNKAEVGHISPRIVSSIILYCAIHCAIDPNNKLVFTINSDLEVDKKLYFEGINKEQMLKKNEVTDDGISNLNALEFFIQNYFSEILSLNKNKDYNDYLQSPIQVCTIQTIGKNFYFADISYPRLAKFISEVGFAELLKTIYNKEFFVLKGEEVIHKSMRSSLKSLGKLSLNKISDGDMIENILKQENFNIDLYIQYCKDNSKFIVIKNKDTNKFIKCNIPIQQDEHITTLLFTWISMKLNSINPEECFFYEESVIDTIYNTLDTTVNTNLSNILARYGFSYQIKEVANEN